MHEVSKMRLPIQVLFKKQLRSFHTILTIQSILSYLRLTMLFSNLTENTKRMNIASLIVITVLRWQLLQNHLILNLAMMESEKFYNEKIYY